MKQFEDGRKVKSMCSLFMWPCAEKSVKNLKFKRDIIAVDSRGLHGFTGEIAEHEKKHTTIHKMWTT